MCELACPARKPGESRLRIAPSEFGAGGFLSPLSTYVTHKMLGSQKLRKRILDDANRVAFYGPCALVEGATGGSEPGLFPGFCAFWPRFPPVYEAGGSVGILGPAAAKRENCRTGKSCLLTLYLVFAGSSTLDSVNSSDEGIALKVSDSRDPQGRPAARGQPLSQGYRACMSATAKGVPALLERRQIGGLRVSVCGAEIPGKSAIYRQKGPDHAHRTAFHQDRTVSLCGYRIPQGALEIRNPDGSVVFRLDDIDVPAQFCQVAADILAQKYFRKAGVPARLKKVEENDVPSFLWRSVPDEAALAKLPEGRALRLRDRRPPGLRPAGRHLDLLGLEGRLFHVRGRCAAPSATSSPTCSPPSASRRIRRNGSTPACTGPTASTAPARAISMSTRSPAS